ncbi:hypothetical protein MY1884_002426 [Beauveria asiatica]
MENPQDESVTPEWSPATDSMSLQPAQASAWADDPFINEIIQEPHCGPWIPLVGQRQPRTPAQSSWNPFMDYRDMPILSEDGTALDSTPRDTHFQYLDDIASLAGPGHEAVGAAQMQHMLGGFQMDNTGPHMPSMRDSTTDATSPFSSTTAGAGLPAGSLKCPHCPKVCTNKSNLKKHEHAHSRPHRCDYPNCSKSKEGFGTPNDLQRHKQSVHQEALFVWRCPHSDCTRVSKPKQWTRKDNFRHHMFKVHHMKVPLEETDAKYRVKLEHLIENTVPSSDAPPSEVLASSSVDAHLTGSSSQVSKTPTLIDVDQSPYQRQQPAMTAMPDGSCFLQQDAHPHAASQHQPFQNLSAQAGLSFGAESAYSLQGNQPQVFGNSPFTTQTVSVADSGIFLSPMAHNHGYQVVAQQGPPSQGISIVDETRPVQSPRASSVFSVSVSAAPATVSSSQATGQKIDVSSHAALVRAGWTTSQLVDHLGTFPIELLEQALKSKTQSSCSSNETEISGTKALHQCSLCGKVYKRACELKKHMKRHDRPYGCTVNGCGKSFGSKNDWKRHECHQHESIDAWACSEDGCIAICESHSAFVQHLGGAHDMFYGEDLHSRVQSCRIGRPSDAKFWCGFCRRVVEIEDVMVQEDGNGTHQSRRFDHIDNHLFGKNGLEKKDKTQWRFLEDEAKVDSRRRMDQMSTTASVRSTTTSSGVPYKRRRSEYADFHPRKRADSQWTASNR